MTNIEILKPRTLKKGDKIGVISPASRPLDENKLYAGIEKLEAIGYQVVLGKNALKERGYLAGSDLDRINDFNSMFVDPEIKAIFCTRGGYGVPRILDKIDFEAIKRNPKIFVGYSDITALNLAIWEKTQLVSFSGPMVAVEFGNGIHHFTENSLWQSIASADSTKQIKNPDDVKLRIINPGEAEGRLIPGCFSVLHGIYGTSYMPDLRGSILVLEDIGEEPYCIDRYFAHLKLSGILDSINGLVLGQFIDSEPEDKSKPTLSIDEVIMDYVKDLKIPVVSNFAYGHNSIKVTIPVGVQAKLDTEKESIFIIEKTVED